MNGLLLVIGVAFLGAAIALFARATILVRVRTAERLAELDAYGFPRPVASEADSSSLAVALDRLAERLAGSISPRLAGIEDQELRTLMLSAGVYNIPPRRFLGYRVLSALCVGLGVGWVTQLSGGSAGITLFALLIAGLAGWVIPLTMLRNRAQKRLSQIDYELPELIDSLVVTVEAGIGFSGALQLASRDLGGPLGDEIHLALQEQRMGLGASSSLENMLQRTDTPAMRSFVRSILQGETLGVSTGEIMRGLAVEMRARRRAAAEERAHKAPVKILFPLVLLLLPAIFIVLLYPAVRSLSQVFGG
jgi:tight adherence protein C